MREKTEELVGDSTHVSAALYLKADELIRGRCIMHAESTSLGCVEELRSAMMSHFNAPLYLCSNFG
jgi:hypothetical protein